MGIAPYLGCYLPATELPSSLEAWFVNQAKVTWGPLKPILLSLDPQLKDCMSRPRFLIRFSSLETFYTPTTTSLSSIENIKKQVLRG
jgi:hypothetical protein